MIFITGSSGYVGSALVPLAKEIDNVIGIDLVSSDHTDCVMDISSPNLISQIKNFSNSTISIINLAAGRFDFGAMAKDYYNLNVLSHKNFLKSLDSLTIKKFVHISSVASIDGSKINYSDDLTCDDAYRSTKYLQEKIIKEWCQERNIELVVMYPSAIFSQTERGDTNIGKMQKLSKFIPFVPDIPIKKTLTYLPKFSEFIVSSLSNNFKSGHYLTIEKPILTVTEMIKMLSANNKRVYTIPFLYQILYVVAKFLYVLGGFGRLDFKLTPNRVVKLFSDTSYNDFKLDIDESTYNSSSSVSLEKILAKLDGATQ